MSEIEVNTFPELSGITDIAITDKWRNLKLQVIAVEVNDANELEALEYTKKLGTFKKETEAAKKTALEPLETQIAKIKAPFKLLAAEIDKLDTMLRDGLRIVMQARRKREEERLRIEREAELKALEAAAAEYEAQGRQDDADKVLEAAIVHEAAPIVAKASAHSISASSSLKKVPKYRIDTPGAVPREYCEPSAGLIWRAVQNAHSKGVKLEIAGVSIWEEDAVGVR